MTLFVAGVDEVGRGPLAGPVVAAAVVFLEGESVCGVADSKRLSDLRRKKLSLKVRCMALDWSIGAATVGEIDELNIHKATLLAMRRAVIGLRKKPDYVYVDGKFFPDIPIPGEAIVHGDQNISAISAASIVAKVSRDEQMAWLDKLYPGYDFGRHKGYPTSFHRSILKALGPTPEHRMTYAPVKNFTQY